MWWLKLWAFILGGRAVYLRSRKGEVYKTIAYVDPWGNRWCHVFCFVKVGHVILRDDFTADPNSESSYIKEWKWA